MIRLTVPDIGEEDLVVVQDVLKSAYLVQGIHVEDFERVVADYLGVSLCCGGKHTYIGPHSIVTKGAILGDRVVIRANSLVNIGIPSNSKAFGTPVRIIGNV